MNESHHKYPWIKIATVILGAMLIPFLWWSLTQYANIPDRFLPSLKSVFNAAIDLEPNLGIHTAATITRLLVGFIGGTVVGIALGIFFSRFPAMDTFFSPSIQALRAIPAAASVPFFLMWFGFSEVGRYLIVFLAVGLNVAVASSQILMGRSLAHRTFFASFRLSPGAFPLSYSLPRIVEDILPTLRFSLALSMGAVTVSELLGSQVGLGYLLQTGRSTFSFNLMFLAIIVIGFVASSADFLLRIIWQRFVYWRKP